MKSKIVILLILAAIALLVIFNLTFRHSQQPDPNRNLEYVNAFKIKSRSSFNTESKYTGRIYTKQKTTLSFEVPGTVSKIYKDDGSKVNKGDLIARINTDRVSALKNSTESSKNQINAELKLIKANLKRATQLFQMGGISRQAFDEVNFKYQAKLAQLDSLNSKVKVVQSDLNKTSIYAPFAGTISERQVDVGSIVNPGEPVVSIFKTDQPEIRVGIPPDKKSQFRKGMSFDFEYNEQLFKATFDSFLPNLTNDNRTLTGIFKARTLKDFSEGDLVYLKYEKANNLAVFVVPEECLTQGVRGLWSILRLRATNPDKNNKTTIKQKKLATRLLKADSSNAIHTIESVPVELIHLKQNLAFIKGGLKENDLIVRHGVHKLVPQQKVNIAKISEGVFGNL